RVQAGGEHAHDHRTAQGEPRIVQVPGAEDVGERAVQHEALEPQAHHAAALAEGRAGGGERVGHGDAQRRSGEQQRGEHAHAALLRAARANSAYELIANRITSARSTFTRSAGTRWFTTSPP